VLTFVQDKNYGYGRNQQTRYREALAAGAEIVVMVHPDYQYTAAGSGHGRNDRLRRLRHSGRFNNAGVMQSPIFAVTDPKVMQAYYTQVQPHS
jgi:hypothetical protein